jgi:hypothetical protein
VTASEQPDDAKQLREEIERTREHLGATVEQLAAKVDVKSRAQAKAAELARQATGAVAQVRKRAAAKGAGAARRQRVPLSAAVAAGLLAAIAFIVWQRSKR